MIVANLIAQVVFGLLAMAIALPSMQEWGELLGASQGQVQLTFSAYVVTYGGLQLIYGPWSDRVGRKPVLAFGLVVALVGSLVAATAGSIEQLIVGRLIQGCGAGASMVISRSMVQDLYAPHERTRIMAYFGMSLGVCPPLATILGGFNHVHFGWQSNFIIVALLAVGLLVALYRFPETRKPQSGGQRLSYRQGLTALSNDTTYLRCLVIMAAGTSAFYCFLSGAPTVLGSYGVLPDGVGFFIMLGPSSYVIGNFLCTRLSSGIAPLRLLTIGHGITLLGIGGMLVGAWLGWHTPMGFAIPMIAVGIGHGLLMPVALARSVGAVPAVAGTAAAFAGTTQQTLGGLSGYLVGMISLTDHTQLAALMLVFTLIAIWMNVRLLKETW